MAAPRERINGRGRGVHAGKGLMCDAMGLWRHQLSQLPSGRGSGRACGRRPWTI
jgi:hypothetical protein